MLCDALILCGGRGQRMGGQDKGLLIWQGKPLLAHVLAQIRGAPIRQYYISANRHRDDYAKFGYPVIPDLRPDFPGPLAGIEAGLLASDADLMLVLPCDVPQLPPDLFAVLHAALNDNTDLACAADPTRRHPVICLLRRSLLPTVQARLDQGSFSLWRWQATIATQSVPFAAPFPNLNDLTSAAERTPSHTSIAKDAPL